MKKCIALACCRPLILLSLSGCLAWSQAEQKHQLIIDMHLHAFRVAEFGVGLGRTPAVCSSNEDTVWYGWDPRTPFKIGGAGSCAGTMLTGSKTDEDLMRQTLTALERYNIRAVTSVLSGSLEEVSKWHAAAPDRIIPAASFRKPERGPQDRPLYREPAELRRLVAEGKIAVFAEVAPQYGCTAKSAAHMAIFAAQTSKFCNFLVCNLLFACDLVSSAALLQTLLIREIPKKKVLWVFWFVIKVSSV